MDARKGNSGVKRSFTPDEEAELLSVIVMNPDMFEDELAHEMYKRTKKLVSITTIGRIVKRHQITRKVLAKVKLGQIPAHRGIFANILGRHKAVELVWFDETGSSDRRRIRKMGRAKIGERATMRLPSMNGKLHSLAACMDINGVGPCELFDGGVNRECFLGHMKRVTLPWMLPHFEEVVDEAGHKYLRRTYNPRSVLIMDNCPTHRCVCKAHVVSEGGRALCTVSVVFVGFGVLKWETGHRVPVHFNACNNFFTVCVCQFFSLFLGFFQKRFSANLGTSHHRFS